MLSEFAENEALALILEGESLTNDEISARIAAAFSGMASNRCICADVYTYRGRTLVLAYPAPPLRERVGEAAIRLTRR